MLTLMLAVLLSAGPETAPATLTASVRLRAEPRIDSPLLGNAGGGEAVRVDLRPVNGYSRITTAEGASGFVPMEVVELGSAKPMPDLRAPQPKARPSSESLEAEDRMPPARASGTKPGAALAWVAVAVGAGVLLANTFRDATPENVRQIRNTNRVGLGIVIVGPLAGLVIDD
jgi:hypothetical protein